MNLDEITYVQYPNRANQTKENRKRQQKKTLENRKGAYQFDSGVNRMKKRWGRGDVLANGTGGGAGDQSQNLIGGDSSGRQPVHPVPGPTTTTTFIVARGSSDSKGYRLDSRRVVVGGKEARETPAKLKGFCGGEIQRRRIREGGDRCHSTVRAVHRWASGSERAEEGFGFLYGACSFYWDPNSQIGGNKRH